MSEWISVEERLPDQSEYVLVFCDGGSTAVSFYSDNPMYLSMGVKRSSYYEGLGEKSKHFGLSHDYGYKITHWMPLPEPPES